LNAEQDKGGCFFLILKLLFQSEQWVQQKRVSIAYSNHSLVAASDFILATANLQRNLTFSEVTKATT
jgi:hypothetical protein